MIIMIPARSIGKENPVIPMNNRVAVIIAVKRIFRWIPARNKSSSIPPMIIDRWSPLSDNKCVMPRHVKSRFTARSNDSKLPVNSAVAMPPDSFPRDMLRTAAILRLTPRKNEAIEPFPVPVTVKETSSSAVMFCMI